MLQIKYSNYKNSYYLITGDWQPARVPLHTYTYSPISWDALFENF